MWPQTLENVRVVPVGQIAVRRAICTWTWTDYSMVVGRKQERSGTCGNYRGVNGWGDGVRFILCEERWCEVYIV